MVPLNANILLVEGRRGEHPSFKSSLMRKGFDVESVSSGNAALQHLQHNLPHVVIIDAASLRTSGKRIIASIRRVVQSLPIVLIVDQVIEDADKLDANAVLVQPFTLQKLVNRIRPLIPSGQKDLIIAGPIHLNPKQRWVRCHDRQSRLTPRLVILLRMLMDHAGEVVDRKELFRQVWDTSYVEDTRTLDVHISWLRQAIEENPQRPRYLKTIRGAGYRLDIEDAAKKK